MLILVIVVQVHRADRAGKAGGNIAPHTSSPSHNDNTHHNKLSSSLDPTALPRLHPEFSHSDWLLLAYKIREIIPCKNIYFFSLFSTRGRFLFFLRTVLKKILKQWLITLKKILDHVIFI